MQGVGKEEGEVEGGGRGATRLLQNGLAYPRKRRSETPPALGLTRLPSLYAAAPPERLLPALLPAAPTPPLAGLRAAAPLAGIVTHMLLVLLAVGVTIGVFFSVGFGALRQAVIATDTVTSSDAGRSVMAPPTEGIRLSPPTGLALPPPSGSGLSASLDQGPAPAGAGAQRPAVLIARGDAFLRTGDIAAARRLYEQAARIGDSQAALRMGATFDRHFLIGHGLPMAAGDPAAALAWYGRALGLGAGPGAIR